MPVLKNPKHELFAQAVSSGEAFDAAYESVGFKRDRRNAEKLRNRPDVVRRVAELLDRREAIDRKSTERAIERLALTKEALARELVPLATSNINDYVRLENDGEPVVDFRRATRAQMGAIRSLEIQYYYTDQKGGSRKDSYADGTQSDSGEGERRIKSIRYSLWPKTEAAMSIARLFGWVIQKTEDVSRLEERLAQMTPEQRRQDALDIFRKAKARLLEDQQSLPAPVEAQAEVVEVEPDDDAAQ